MTYLRNAGQQMSMTVPRRRGFTIAATVLWVTIKAYLARTPDISFEVGHD